MKKKRNRIAKLTDQDYSNYIMALKDSRPVNVVIPEEKKEK